MKALKLLIALLLCIGLIGGIAYALPVTIEELEVDDVEIDVNETNLLDVERGNRVEVEVRLSSGSDLSDVEVEAFISGYEYNDVDSISDRTHTFDMDANVTYVKRLYLDLSDLIDEDAYKLRIIVSDRFSDELVQSYNLKIDVPRHMLKIEDVLITPNQQIMAGRALLVGVRLDNRGEKDEDDVRVQASIPELGVSATDYINEIENDEEEETEELYLKLPRCAEAGIYDLRIEVDYDNHHRKLTESLPIEVTANDMCEDDSQPTTMITVANTLQQLARGDTVAFPITINNNGLNAQSYTITVTGADGWGSTSLSPSNVVVVGQKSAQTVYVFASADDKADLGSKALSVVISSGEETLHEGSLAVNVIKDTSGASTRKIMEVLLIGLIVVLVVVVLILAAMRWNAEGGDKAKPYY